MHPISTTLPHPLANLQGSDWYHEFFEVHDPRLCHVDVLQDAHDSAPTSEARAYVFAILEFREALVWVSGLVNGEEAVKMIAMASAA